MRTIYLILTLFIFTALILGVDGWFGTQIQIKGFSAALLVLWAAQTVIREWSSIKEFREFIKD